MDNSRHNKLVLNILQKKAGILDAVTSLATVGGNVLVKGKETSDRLKAIDEEISANNKAIQQLQSVGSNSIAIRRYVERNVKLQEERETLTKGTSVI